ncbi:MAG: helix-turn-helix domain-containing protein [Myxococcota bacterium]
MTQKRLPAAERREQILRTARTMIRERGIDGFALRELARELGIRAPSLYRYFESKESLLIELQVESIRLATACIAEHAAAWEGAQETPPQAALAGILGSVSGAFAMPVEHSELLSLSTGPRRFLSDKGFDVLREDLKGLFAGPYERLHRAAVTGALCEGDAGARTIRLWMLVQGAFACAKYSRVLPGWPTSIAEALPATRDLLRGWGASEETLRGIDAP